MMNAYWRATLSDGSTAQEHKGNFQVIPGERKPWIRLINGLEGRHLTSLILRIGKRTVHMPRINDKFPTLPPKGYGLCYHVEIDDIFGSRKEKHFVDLTTYYDDFQVHYIQDINDGNNSWVTVTKDDYVPEEAHETR